MSLLICNIPSFAWLQSQVLTSQQDPAAKTIFFSSIQGLGEKRGEDTVSLHSTKKLSFCEQRNTINRQSSGGEAMSAALKKKIQYLSSSSPGGGGGELPALPTTFFFPARPRRVGGACSLYGTQGNSRDQSSELSSSMMTRPMTVAADLTCSEDELSLIPDYAVGNSHASCNLNYFSVCCNWS